MHQTSFAKKCIFHTECKPIEIRVRFGMRQHQFHDYLEPHKESLFFKSGNASQLLQGQNFLGERNQIFVIMCNFEICKVMITVSFAFLLDLQTKWFEQTFVYAIVCFVQQTWSKKMLYSIGISPPRFFRLNRREVTEQGTVFGITKTPLKDGA